MPKSKLVTSNSEGGFLMKRNIRRAMTSVCKQAGIKKISFHELRHTHATLMLEMNEHQKIVQQRLGHAKVETTLNIYSHVRPQIHQNLAERFSNFFDAGSFMKSRHCFVTAKRLNQHISLGDKKRTLIYQRSEEATCRT
ncbi:tyrosine-type recombinase/integrase [Enterococcus hulanensis]|uniref:Tyrosine-type recombinase/integrase n=1 Tax=Enterococcus hulanensis TaxID=2559929 RepID=A0ABU3F314_9ENTE|nr:tyrosine-type recombinase/integrase [Enterococcus hulanensis]MDT2601526.1 tyrosine-type recombinase/integrase [Enterococcus hulanensis]MDT2610931.1 tyrosine-type recombinase/integrase [Enterococcus hulanensis]MDT2618336.1 tyrosine-type recombinase/integrase [Enterococcus hulanensis]MDT2629461.1 tyrosine-type recombinase/integrase [Enterococcus hulanensis]MDT2657023.1 tyrosine-type recombinase/integrase [Enterococcus hulanensis]